MPTQAEVWKLLRASANRRHGMRPAQAASALVAMGLDGEEAERLSGQAVLAHNRRFCASWLAWFNQHGYMEDLAALSPEERLEFDSSSRGQHLRELIELTGAHGHGPPLGIIRNLGKLSKLVSALDGPQHPGYFALTKLHGLPDALALLVFAYRRVVPGWALAAIGVLIVVCLLVFGIALIDPQNAMFRSDGASGAGPLQLILLPLMTLGFCFALFTLAREKAPRERAYRELLEQYRKYVESLR